MQQRSQYHLILDRADPDNPRWVIAKELASKPAQVPDDLDDDPRPTKWLGEFSNREFSWMQFLFGRETSLRITQRGEESSTTRIAHPHSPRPEHPTPACCQAAYDDAEDGEGGGSGGPTQPTAVRRRATPPGNTREHGVWGHLHDR